MLDSRGIKMLKSAKLEVDNLGDAPSKGHCRPKQLLKSPSWHTPGSLQ